MIVFDNVKKLLDGKTVLDLKELTIPKGALYGIDWCQRSRKIDDAAVDQRCVYC